MTTHAGLSAYRDQLRDSVARDLEHRGRSRLSRRGVITWAVPAAALAAATAAVLITVVGGAASPTPADAAILRHVSAALTPAPGEILHEHAVVSLNGGPGHVYELWADTSNGAYHVAKFGHEATGTSNGSGVQDAATSLRALVQSGDATVVGPDSVDGTPAWKLHVSGAADPFLNGTVYVAQSNYEPLLIQTDAARCDTPCTETIRYQAYEYLPRTAENLARVGG
jgi:hypothetical protein